jgi:hypothetical protein
MKNIDRSMKEGKIKNKKFIGVEDGINNPLLPIHLK